MSAFYSYQDPSVRLTGRWDTKNGKAAITTAPGSYFEIAFEGDLIALHFDMTGNAESYPHLWISLDGGPMVESVLTHYIRIKAKTAGKHTAAIHFKSAVEMQNRWLMPDLVGKVAFTGYDAEGAAELAPDNRKVIEFVGDSITEGVLIDEFYSPITPDRDQPNRPYQDDALATYSALTADALDLRRINMGYGAVGACKSGCGDVPLAWQAYPYNFEGSPIEYPSPDYIVINHGANDGGFSHEEYIRCYEKLLDVIIKMNPNAAIVALCSFHLEHHDELEAFIPEYNKAHGTDVHFISSKGWVARNPGHPYRDGHQQIADHLIPELKKLWNL